MGCPGSLISIKSRHSPDSGGFVKGRGMAKQTEGYAKSIRNLLIWEHKHITETMSFSKGNKE